MSSTYNHLRKKSGENERGMEILIREEGRTASGAARSGGVPVTNVESAASSKSSTLSATQLQGESAVTAPPPPFLQMQAEEQSSSGGTSKDQLSHVGWPGRRGARGMRTCNSDTKRLGCAEPSATNERGLHTKRV
jgi:hypothetical protein